MIEFVSGEPKTENLLPFPLRNKQLNPSWKSQEIIIHVDDFSQSVKFTIQETEKSERIIATATVNASYFLDPPQTSTNSAPSQQVTRNITMVGYNGD